MNPCPTPTPVSPAGQRLRCRLPAAFLALSLPAPSAAPVPAIHAEYNSSLRAVMPLEQGWQNPPRLARTRVWWWWLNGHVTKEAITRDLEEMKATGIGGANIIDAGGDDQRGNLRVPHGPDFATPDWRKFFVHALAEADRLDLELGFNIVSGWNLGGPMVTPENASKILTHSSTRVRGGTKVQLSLPLPKHRDQYYRDVAVIACPARGTAAPAFTVKAISQQSNHAPEHALDGNPETFWVSNSTKPGQGPAAKRPTWLEISPAHPLSVDAVVLHPRPGYGPKTGRIEIESKDGPRSVAFEAKRDQPVEIRFPATAATRVRIVATGAFDPIHPDQPRNVQIAEVALLRAGKTLLGPATTTASIRDFEQKAYYRYPGSACATLAWHLLDDFPEKPGDVTCQPGETLDLTQLHDGKGNLEWNAPAGEWEIIRLGYTTSGASVSTFSQGWGGRAIDYLDRDAFQSYWQQVIAPIMEEAKPFLGKSLRFLHTDSWELGPVNWTKRMPEEFARLRGYPMTPFLPVLAGKIVGNRETTTRFLNDFRRTLADLMAENKYITFSQHAHALGMGIHPESGGPHAGPMDALRNLGISDVPMGEFWARAQTHRVQDHERFFVKQTTSAAHVYGRRISLAEAFTTIGPHWTHDPCSLKPTFDRAACEGHNLTMWHTFDCSPREAGLPGYAYFAGTHFNPNITWWDQAPAFIGFLNRCHFLLQQGLGVADVLHFYGENVPSFVRLKRDDPARCLPGHDYDVIDLQALLTRTKVDENGLITLPDGTNYRLLSLEPRDVISLPALRHIAALVEAGATILGPRPRKQYSLSGFEAGDAEFSKICDRLWGTPAIDAGENPVGKGRVIWGSTAWETLAAKGIGPDFTWHKGDSSTLLDYVHRRTDDTHLYYIVNRNDRAEDVELSFRVAGFIPEIWDPVDGSREEAKTFRVDGDRTIVPVAFDREQSFFFLFRKPLPAGSTARSAGPNRPLPQPRVEIEGPWQVRFDPNLRGPAEPVAFDRLSDWSSHPDPAIRFYSGAAVYSKTIDLPADALGGRVFLDLGDLDSLCEVRWNGADLGVLWARPFRVEVTGKARPGRNQLEVKVVNVWDNRLIGDASLPPEQRLTRTNITAVNAKTPLARSGLLGPVRILTENAAR